MRSLKNLIRRGAAPANILATTALVCSLSGTAYAAIVVTGLNVKNGTLTGADVKDRSLTKTDLSATTITQLRGLPGAQGAKGATGPTGPKGETGAQGAAGKDGAPALVVASYAQERPGTSGLTPGFDKYISPTGDSPNSPVTNAWNLYDNVGGEPDGNPADAVDSRYSQPKLSGVVFSDQPNLLSLTDGQANGGLLAVNFSSFVTGQAAITLMHKGSVHTRAECQLFVDDNGTRAAIGQPVYVSSNLDHEMVTVSLVGTGSYTASATNPKLYNVLVRCRAGDHTGQIADEWEYVRGNLTAFAASR